MENLLLKTVTEAQAILEKHILPDSKKSAEDTINELLGVLDDEVLVSKMKSNLTLFWPTSGNIERTTYQPSKEILEVEFLNGGVYMYKDVPKPVWQVLKESNSIGSSFHRNVKGKYRYEKTG